MPALPLRTAALAAALALLCPRAGGAQVVQIPRAARAGAVPRAPGTGAQIRFVHAFYGGFPWDLRDARDMLDGTAFTPIFDVHCGLAPYVDFTNATVRDSAGRQAPDVLCFPFIDPDRSDPPATCRDLPGAPHGDYYSGGGAAMRVAAWLAVRAAGKYTFAWGHDDGVGMYVGDTTVFEFPGPTGSRVDRRVVSFPEAGLYPVRLDWYDGVGGALLDWYIAPGDETAGTFQSAPFALVPTEDLYPSGALPCTPRCTPCPAEAPRCDYAAGRCVRCLGDAQCGACERCVAGACVAVSAACTPDAGRPPDAERGVDAGADAALDAAVGAGGEPGCGCVAAGSVRTTCGAWALAALVLAAAGRRRKVLPPTGSGVPSGPSLETAHEDRHTTDE